MIENASISILIIQHEEYVKPGEYLRWARRRGIEPAFIRCWESAAFPKPENLPDLLIVLGGPQDPGTTRAECPHYDAQAEMELIRRCAAGGKMVVGACLGAQLMGQALGACFSHSPEREVGPTPLRLTEAGRADPLLHAFPDRFIGGESHNDMAGLPEGSTVLAESDGCPRQIIRFGTYLYGLQTHLEFDREIVAEILENIPSSLSEPEKHPFVQSREAIVGYDYSEMNALLSSLLDALTEKWLSRGETGEAR